MFFPPRKEIESLEKKIWIIFFWKMSLLPLSESFFPLNASLTHESEIYIYIYRNNKGFFAIFFPLKYFS